MRSNRAFALARLALFTLLAACGGGAKTNPGINVVPFYAFSSPALQGANNPALAWGDEDGDGLLDLVLAGNIQATGPMTRIHQNLGGGAFSAPLAGITDVDFPAVAWGDYDNDGLLDLVVAGVPASGVATTTLYRNQGGSVFATVNSGLPGFKSGALAWADYDNDGRLDLAIAGLDVAGQALTAIYRNAPGAGKVFTNSNASLVALGSHPSLAWGDYDNDGRIDLVAMGHDPSQGAASHNLYLNAGAGAFTTVVMGIGAYVDGGIAWGDYDNDGKLDLALTGKPLFGPSPQGTGAMTQVWRNDATAFTGFSVTQGWGIGGVGDGSVVWGDYDSDGLLDLAAGGLQNGGPCCAGGRLAVYRNQGSGQSTFFTVPAGLPDFGPVALGWGDADADGHLDLGVNGLVGTTELAIVYQNQNLNGAPPNAPPSAPTNVSATTVGSVTEVRWDPATDAVTKQAGLSYNLRVGTTPTDSSLYPSMADGTGRRRIPAMGLVRHNPSLPALLMLPGGSQTFYVSVQAIDGGLAGGPWSTPISFVGP